MPENDEKRETRFGRVQLRFANGTRATVKDVSRATYDRFVNIVYQPKAGETFRAWIDGKKFDIPYTDVADAQFVPDKAR